MSVHPQLGANPLSIVFVTGVNARSPRYPLSKLSRFSESGEPLRGIPVHGPHARLPAAWQEMSAVIKGYLPPATDDDDAKVNESFPVLRRYTDSDYLPPMSEPTIAEYAKAVVAFGLLVAPPGTVE